MRNTLSIHTGRWGKRLRKKVLLNQIPLTNLVQRLFKAANPVSQALGTEAIDYSAVPVNATVWQSCMTDTGTEKFLDTPIVVNWATDGVKFEFVTSLAVGQTSSIVVSGPTTNHGVRIYTTMLRIYGYKADGSTVADIQFPAIDNVADDSFSRYRITKSGNNITVEKTIPSDVNFTGVGKVSETVDVSSFNLSTQSFRGSIIKGKLCYLNIDGNKFSFGDGNLARKIYSYTSARKFVSITPETILSDNQNVYCHNAIFGYTRAYIKHDTNYEEVNIPYQEDGTPATGFHTDVLANATFQEFPANKSFGMGYGIKLNSAMLEYDQANTFFDGSDEPKLLYKKDVPSRLNSRIFFDHKNNSELLVYSADKTITRPINTARKTCLLIGDSLATGSYYWDSILERLSGLVKTNAGYSGKRLSVDVLALLQADVATTPALISDKDFVFIGGVFNDYGQNVSNATYLSGVTTIFNYVRAQNATAKIFLCGMYNGGNPFDDGTTPNGAGLTYNSARAILEQISETDNNCHYIDWNTSGIQQSEVDSSGIHPLGPNGGYRIANLIYEKLLEIY